MSFSLTIINTSPVEDQYDDMALAETSRFSFFTAISDMADKY